MPADALARLRSLAETVLPDFLADLERLVNTDCGSYTKTGVDEVGRWTADRLRSLGATVEIDVNAELGDTVVARFHGRPGGPRVLLIGHLDTVFDPGTAAERPFRIQDGRAYGPGVTDMKSGLLAGIYALGLLRKVDRESGADAGVLPFERLTYIANPDEEIGSPVSGPVIRREAAESDVALVLECARANGDIVSSRKGILDIRLHITGKAAHAGVEPEKGRSAVLEAAHKTLALHGLNGRWPGVTANVGVVAGGTRSNVVPERCTLEVDVRSPDAAGLDAAHAAVLEIARTSTVADVTTTVEQLAGHRPMEKLEASGRLVDLAVELARGIGFAVRDTATGGASDANTTSGMGIPTLDGLGPIGGLDHSPGEYLDVDSIAPRTALLAALLLAISRDPVAASSRADAAPRGEA